MAFQANAFQTNAFQICATTARHKRYDGTEEVTLRYKREDEEQREILIELGKREEIEKQVRLIARTEQEELELMELLMALLLSNEA